MQLAGSVALVTGAGQGIGKAIVERLAAHGVPVAVNDINPDAAERLCRQLVRSGQSAMAAPADVSDQGAVDTLFDRIEAELGSVDLLVNNAAASAEYLEFVDTTPKTQHEEMVTFTGVMHCTRRALPGMIAGRAGRIINISSISGHHGAPGRAIYSGAKAGIEAFSKALSAEVCRHGISVNCISPGTIETPRFKGRSPQISAELRGIISMGRFGEPEEVAQAVLFLASDMADYVSGAVLKVDGGIRSPPPIQRDATEGSRQ